MVLFLGLDDNSWWEMPQLNVVCLLRRLWANSLKWFLPEEPLYHDIVNEPVWILICLSFTETIKHQSQMVFLSQWDLLRYITWRYLEFTFIFQVLTTKLAAVNLRQGLLFGEVLSPAVAPRVWVAACLSCGNSLFCILQGMCAPASCKEADKILSSVLSACHSPQSVGGY